MIDHISSGESFDAIFIAARAGNIESFFRLVDLARKAALMVSELAGQQTEDSGNLSCCRGGTNLLTPKPIKRNGRLTNLWRPKSWQPNL